MSYNTNSLKDDEKGLVPTVAALEMKSGSTVIPDVNNRSGLFPKVIRRAFVDQAIEDLYQQYCRHHKQSDVECFFAAGFLAAVHSSVSVALTDDWNQSGAFVFVSLSGGIALVEASLGWCSSRSWAQKDRAAVPMTYTGWLLVNTLIMGLLYFDSSSRWAVTWMLLSNFLTFVTLPLRLLTCLALTLTASLLFLLLSPWNVNLIWKEDGLLPRQVTADVLLLLSSISLGLVAYLVADNRQRRAFLDTRQSLEMRLTVEEQAREQEQLLLSVLPEHIAVKMRQDLGTAHDGQFKKIYMSRHENVSILFADIVGFTAISSTYPASELVHILNELFARFDRLAQKYDQMRIKILGDCYYCICGAPVERPDHAVLCVYMGLAMIDAIRCVRESTLSPVDMRVGIHTGAVLAGVLGQRQWQFDVYSQDVELANKMESSGTPGRVHVSSRALGFLDDQFEVEAAYGERREEALRLAGIETYFILRAKIPMSDSVEEESKVPSVTPAIVMATLHSETREQGCLCFQRCQVSHYVESSVKEPLVSTHLIDQETFGTETANRTGCLTQTFLDDTKEGKYQQHHDATALYNFLALPIALAFAAVFTLWTRPWSPYYGFYLATIILLLVLFVTGLADSWKTCSANRLGQLSTFFNSNLPLRFVCVVLALFLLVATHLAVYMTQMKFPWPQEGAVILLSVSLVPHLSSCCKSLLILFLSIIYASGCWMIPLLHTEQAESGIETGTDHPIPADENAYWIYRKEEVNDSLLIALLTSSMLLAIATALISLTRHLESTSRLLFLWQHHVEEQRERAADLRRRNQTLVCNILPPHVAAHFLSARRQVQQQQQAGEQLYSQSYTDVGVLFASIANFAEFYSEETVNNQGLECLRFLNEVISDFDALLDRSQFSEITKIKTIGSTYMAASGLNCSPDYKPSDDVLHRWRHLALLVEFAFVMQKTLQSINDQSFNHFVLRMGINHGPITAGVIGASKPHYDIWGNAVNVASRMESTGKAGCIQVTEETMSILRQFGYQFEQRGLVSIKGKGQLLTYYLLDKEGQSTNPP